MPTRTTPPKPPNPPSSSSHPVLKLHRDEPAPSELGPVPATYRFPVAAPSVARARGGSSRTARAAKERLVGARVSRVPIERRFVGSESPCAVVNETCDDEHPCAGRIMSSRDLVKEIESTLDRMQNRLSSFRRQVDESFQFPTTSAAKSDPDQPPPCAA